MSSTVLVRCLIFNLVVLFGSAALLLWYPRNSGFTITSGGTTHYFNGGVFLGTVLIVLFDLALAAYLGWRLWHPEVA